MVGKKWTPILAILISVGYWCDRDSELFGQATATSMEFMESSSPLKRGGVVTSRAVSGQPVTTYITKYAGAEPTPATGSGTLLTAQSANPNSNAQSNAPPNPASPSSVVGSITATNVGESMNEPPPVYAYPATTPAGPTPIFPQTDSVLSGTPARRGWLRRPCFLKHWLGCKSSCLSRLRGASPTASPSIPAMAPADQVPSITYPQNSGVAATGTPGTNVWEGNSIYTPTKPLPPGTFLGLGFLGQPEAYVNSQPVRNLFRFMTPF